MPQQIILDHATFKALAGEKRIAILKLLQQRNHMQTELAQCLGLAVPTVKEHLDFLANAGLVEMRDEGRKWKYYALTQKGRALVEPREEKYQLLIMLGLFVFAVVGGILDLLKTGTVQVVKMSAVSDVLRAPSAEAGTSALQSVQAVPLAMQNAGVEALTNQTVYWIALVVLLVLVVVFLVKYLCARKRN